jgi:hypothetical protein
VSERSAPGSPRFLIVGTPRSGTTLTQRLACELPGVKVPPETHFFARFYPRSFRWSFPLQGAELREATAAFTATKRVQDAHLDADRLVERLGGRADGPLELFAAVVEEMASGGATIYGEKTPPHLSWWGPLSRGLPSLKLIAIVRDPRAVVASWLDTPWMPPRRDGYVLVAERWRLDQREIARAADALGPKRCLLLRYEDVVVDPDRTRSAIATVIGAEGAEPVHTPDASELYLPWETVKSRSVGEITADRVRAWEERLPSGHARRIEAICRTGMRRFGYPTALGAAGAAAVQATLSPRTNASRVITSVRRRRELARIERVRLF